MDLHRVGLSDLLDSTSRSQHFGIAYTTGKTGSTDARMETLTGTIHRRSLIPIPMDFCFSDRSPPRVDYRVF